jgi:hypothetical protein
VGTFLVYKWDVTSKIKESREEQIPSKIIMFKEIFEFENAIIICCGR